MAQVEHLPIYRTALKLAVHLETVVKGFPRYTKYTLGSELRAHGQQILLLIVRAHGNVAGRVERLRELRTAVELVATESPGGGGAGVPDPAL
jgi:hypothetical protein